jgi:pyruvate/2-oxoglutarate dehydrogenase complex dihydrolipoamide acyltransferase (E2) component
MADDSGVSELLLECHDMLVDMACQNIPCASLQAMFTYFTNELPSLSFDRRVERLRTFIAVLEKTKEKYRNAADAAAQTAAAPAAVAAVAATAAAQSSQDFCEWQDDAAAAEASASGAAHQSDQAVHGDLTQQLVPVSRACKLRPSTLSKCEKVRDFALAFVKQQMANQENPSRITVSVIAQAYAEKTTESHKTAETLFKNEYLDLKSIIAAARGDMLPFAV